MNKLYIVPTPIGNIEDITYRAIKILKSVDLIFAEDTRKSKILLKYYDIGVRLRSYHKFNEHKITKNVIETIRELGKVALISDAGTPGISDPGFLLVKDCIENNIDVECLPGANAFVPALINSGLPADKFCFEGFLPHKKGRLKRLKQLQDERRTIIFYESPYRLQKTLSQLAEYLGDDRRGSVSKEISKLYEENIRGTLQELIHFFSERNIKGEYVIVVTGCS